MTVQSGLLLLGGAILLVAAGLPIKLPKVGSTSTADSPTLLWRPASNLFNIDFVPASGSNLPISLIFYKASTQSAFGGIIKRYNP